jgi:dienelactone hydrolase
VETASSRLNKVDELINEDAMISRDSDRHIFGDIARLAEVRGFIPPQCRLDRKTLPRFAGGWLQRGFGRASQIGVFAIALLITSGCLTPSCFAQEESANERETTAKNHVAVPDLFSIETPNKEVPDDIAVFSGAWAGDGWNGIIPAALVVEKIDQAGKANVIFSWGNVVATKRPRGWLRAAANIDHGSLTFSIPDHGQLEFSLTADGRLFGRYIYLSGRRDYTVLARVVPADKSTIIAASQKTLSWEDVTFPVASIQDPAKVVRLHGLLYRNGAAGRQPLAIFCADSVYSEEARARPSRAPIKARQMLGLGYSVLVLQRKGAGGSEGPFMEPRDLSVPQRTQLQSALDDLDAAVTFMKQQEYVDPSRIVVMGVNRGGLLSVAYAGLHDGAVAGVVNTSGIWKVRSTWWERLFSWEDFTAAEFANAGKKTKVPMLWIYGGTDPAAVEYARKNFKGFTYQGGRGTFVDVLSDGKSDPSSEPLAAKEERAIVEYIQSLKRGG